MTDIGKLLRKYFSIFLFIFFTIHIFFIFANFYFINLVTKNNLLSISSFIETYSENFEDSLMEQINYTKKIFPELEHEINEKKIVRAYQIKNFIQNKFNSKYDVAIISESGIIFDTTFKPELNLNLNRFPDARNALVKSKQSHQLLIDAPVLNSSHKYFNIYALKYFPEKNFYIQLSYKLNMLNRLLKNLKILKRDKNYTCFVNIIYVYKHSKYKFYQEKIFGSLMPFNEKVFKKLMSNSKNQYIKTTFSQMDYYKLFKYDYYENIPKYGIIYNIKIKSVYNKTVVAFFFGLNIFLIMLYYFIYKTFYKKSRDTIVKPLQYISNSIKTSTPLSKGEINIAIREVKELTDAYSNHLENIRLKDFLKNLFKVQEDERERIVKYVHDSIIQDLNYILIQLKKMEEKELADILLIKIGELRELIDKYDISIMRLYGLKMFLSELVERFQKKYSHIIFMLDFKGNDEIDLDFDQSRYIVRIIQEIINNAAIHSECTSVFISIVLNDRKITILIRDNGKGFNLEEAMGKRGHFGLINIRERVYLLNGKLSISTGEKGSDFFIEIPIDKKPNL